VTNTTAYSLSISSRANTISEEEQGVLEDHVKEFIKKHGITSANIRLSLQEHAKKRRGKKEYTAKINLHSDKGVFTATESSYGAVKSVHDALSILREQLMKRKHSSKKPEEN